MQSIHVNGVDLGVRTDGDPAHPALLLLHGAGHSSAAWDERFCARLAAGERFVIRLDSRDAGISTTYPPGQPDYALRDLVADVVGTLDALDVRSAHVLGMSQGAATAQLLAIEHPERVTSLALHASTPGGPGHHNPDLPGPTQEINALFTATPAEPDWSDRTAVIDHLVAAERPFAAASRPFDLTATRALATRLYEHARAIAAQVNNPFLIDAGAPWRDQLSSVHVSTVVFHGSDDPFLPPAHGEALSREISGARFVSLPGTGHEIFPEHTWDTVLAVLADLHRLPSRPRPRRG
ncbi:alpha/beta fold hydrolase [Plantactinospora sp. GCM10030261]|uniref:alpha/beta fold hydrolase n=1 Tax=Plantactinospora sp. GCM10030261 TaxID=3273420 RepID=UPI00361DDA2C